MQLETMIVNFWTFKDGCPAELAQYHHVVGRIQVLSADLTALTRAYAAPVRAGGRRLALHHSVGSAPMKR